jgi:hypothetical protein
MRDHTLYAAACKQAEEEIEAIYLDPMTKYSGVADEIVEAWMRTHIKACEKCREATFEANMP